MLSPDVDGCNETLNHRKTKKNDNVLKKTILERIHQLSASRFLHFVFQGGFALLPPLVIATLIGGPTSRLLRIWGVNGLRPQFFHSGWHETHIASIGNKSKYRCIPE